MTTETKFNFLKFMAKLNTENILYRILMGINLLVLFMIEYLIRLCFDIDIDLNYIIMVLICIIIPIISPSVLKIQKVDGILLTKLGNTARVSMEYSNYESFTNRDMAKMFKESAELLFSSNYLQKLKVNRVYIYTHTSLAKKVISKLHEKNDVQYLKENYDNAIEKGWMDINGYKVIIKFHKEKSNDLLTSRVSNSDTIDKKTEALQKKKHYKITIPVELFYTKKQRTS